jgi:hypothetical protein
MILQPHALIGVTGVIGVIGGRREFEPPCHGWATGSFGIDGAVGCRAVAKWRRAVACLVRMRGACHSAAAA